MVGPVIQGKEPRWLRPLLSASYFAQCGEHGDSSTAGARCERNMFCADCAGGALCVHYLPHHGGHRVVQVRRSSYHDVVMVSEVCWLIDVSCVQTYVINGAKIVFLNERPQPARPPAWKAGAGRWCGEVCGRGLLDSFRFCSFGCKSDLELTFVLHGKLGLETATVYSSVPGKVRRTAAASGRGRDAAGICPGTPPPICSYHRPPRRRKSAPRRAPPY